jgi:hypothetical protein
MAASLLALTTFARRLTACRWRDLTASVSLVANTRLAAAPRKPRPSFPGALFGALSAWPC